MPDYGCYVFIENRIEIAGKGVPLVLTDSDAVFGNWSLPPPPTIAFGEKVRIELADSVGAAGSEGLIRYASQFPSDKAPTPISHEPDFVLKFACPTVLPPKNSVTVNEQPSRVATTFYAKSGSDVREPIEQGHWGPANDCPWSGNPLAIWLVLTYNPNF